MPSGVISLAGVALPVRFGELRPGPRTVDKSHIPAPAGARENWIKLDQSENDLMRDAKDGGTGCL